MPVVSIRHLTTYRYRNPVGFGEHRMMLRPLESYDQRLISAELTISPNPSSLRYVHDLFGNCVAIARFEGRADVLSFESQVLLDHRPQPGLAAFQDGIEAFGANRPFVYGEEDLPDLMPSIAPLHADPDGELAAWARRFIRPVGRTSLSTLLSDMTYAIRGDFTYGTRLAGHPQSPLETLASRAGSCRDFAVLMMEAARSLGLAAQFVSGYVYSSAQKGRRSPGRVGGGHTHAWMRVYLPACGWVEFDPTNGIVGGQDLVRVAVARDPRQALPLHGAYSGLASDFLGMDVEVDVSVEAEDAATPLRVAQG